MQLADIIVIYSYINFKTDDALRYIIINQNKRYYNRDTVMRLLKQDPEGVAQRRARRLRRRSYNGKVTILLIIITCLHLIRIYVMHGSTLASCEICHNTAFTVIMLLYYHMQGPNHVWHLDGYDKLAPFGLYIHGCVDG